jgi:hypothetical protein
VTRLSPGRFVLRGNPICHNLPMCGRYRLSQRKQLVEEYFDCGSDEPDWAPRNNITPTQPVARDPPESQGTSP